MFTVVEKERTFVLHVCEMSLYHVFLEKFRTILIQNVHYPGSETNLVIPFVLEGEWLDLKQFKRPKPKYSSGKAKDLF